MRRTAWWILGSAATGVLLGSVAQGAELSFERRVAAHEAIERVYQRHQQGDSRPFIEAVPRSHLEEKVRRYLQQTVALEDHWKTPITGAVLEAELRRMVQGSRMPGRLEELFAALDHDPLLIQECLVRPALVERLARNFFESDERVHGAQRAAVEQLREAAFEGSIDERSKGFRRVEIEVVPSADPEERPEVPEVGAHTHRNPMRREDFESLRQRSREWERGVEAVVERPDAFVFRVRLAEQASALRLASYSVPKQTWEAWWATVRGRFDRGIEIPPPLVPLPSPALGSATTSCQPDDTWYGHFTADQAPSARSSHTAIWTGNLMIVWGGDASAGPTNTGGRYDPATDTWSPTSPINAPVPRYGHTATWTGSRMVVFGGQSAVGWLDSGAMYDPTTDSWIATPPTSPGVGYHHTAVWTGSRMLVWSGFGGLAYDPTTNAWTYMSHQLAQPSGRVGHSAVWTGSEMIVWGGGSNGQESNTGFRYSPLTDTFVILAPAPLGRAWHEALWTGSRMIVWQGWGASYDPATDSWIVLDSPLSLPPVAVWTGSRMIFWGGFDLAQAEGWVYDPAADSWMPTSMINAPAPRFDHTAVWTGDQMIVWGGGYDSGGRYDPASDMWTPTRIGPSQMRGSNIWTGSFLVAWGGGFLEAVNTGERYDPATDSWARMSMLDAPDPRWWHSTVWSGSELIVWGGLRTGYSERLDTGGRYDPLRDTWTATSLVGAPSARSYQLATWTGTRMFVWSGYDGTMTPSGGLYDPQIDGWVQTSLSGVPSPRFQFSIVWTGSRVVIWGGNSFDTPYFGDGARYDPDTDSWAPMTLSGAPSARYNHSAVWTGDEMVLWGGHTSSGVGTASGGRYDPATDSWSSVSLSGAPSGRSEHSAVWAHDEMVIFGGEGVSWLNDGARYRPATDTWVPLPITGAPAMAPEHPEAFWTGGSMLVWGKADPPIGAFYALGQSVDHDGDGTSVCAGDCDDTAVTIHPGAAEQCNWIDDDCDGTIPGVETDVDGDVSAPCEGDCNDADPTIRPGLAELCDHVDQNCDGLLDETFDVDGDSYTSCELPAPDCDDADPTVHPGASEINDGQDNQCPGDAGHGIVDEIAATLTYGPGGQICWTDTSGATTYEIARSPSPDFDPAVIIGTVTSPDMCVIDPTLPPPGGQFYYLIRAIAPLSGSWGQSSSGQEHVFDTVPACSSNLSCDDGDPCTEDTCDVNLGCLQSPGSGATCDDGNACTTVDVCNAGACVGSAPRDCNDGVGCTIDFCIPASGVCGHSTNNAACNDGNACTFDGCNLTTDCQHFPLSGNTCDDGSACTTGDVCSAGTCHGSVPGQANHLVISQVQVSGVGINEFIEIYNPTASAVSLNGWGLQYRAQNGFWWGRLYLPPVSLPSHRRFLVGGTGYSGTPIPDWGFQFPLDPGGGTVALSSAGNPLSGCSTSGVVDMLAYGTGFLCPETAPVPAPGPNNSVEREPGGACGNGTDTNNNAADFNPLVPATPRNLASPPAP
jgi:Putative metal-binding motif/Kelch motif